MDNVIEVATAPLDKTCKAILGKLKEGGWDKAGVTYLIDANQVSLSEFSYLLKHGGIAQSRNAQSISGVLKSYGAAKHGPDVGKVAFQLNCDLI